MATSATRASPPQSYSPTSAMWFAVQRNGLSAATGPSTSRPLATHRTTITIPEHAGRAGPTEHRPERERETAEAERDGAHPEREAEARQGRDRVAETDPNVEATTLATASTAIVKPRIVTWAASFSSAIRRLPNGAAATMSSCRARPHRRGCRRGP